MNKKAKPKQLSLRFKNDEHIKLHGDLKRYCFENEIVMNDFILEALKEKLEKLQKK